MVDGELNFITKLDKTGFTKGTKAIGNGLGDLKSKLKSLAKVAAAAFSVKIMYDFAKASKEAYNVQIEQETKLTTIMKQRMSATNEQIDSVKKLAAEQQRLGVIGDEVQLAGAQQVATFLNEADSIKTLLPAMNDLLAQQNGLNATTSDAVNIGNLMGKVLQGQTSALKRVGISFSDAEEQVLKYGTESERAAMLAQVITNNVGHMNQALAQTDAGKQKQLANTMGDIKEQFGQAVQTIESVFMPVLARLVNWFGKVATAAQTVSTAIRSAFGVDSPDNSAAVATTTATAAASAAESYDDMAESAEETKKAQENSLASFDKVIKLGKKEESSGSGKGSGENGQGKTPVTKIPVKPSTSVSWADEIKKAFRKGDWEGAGKLFADKVNSVFGKVNWDKIREKLNNGVQKITGLINGFTENFNWKGMGEAIGEGITTAFSAAYTFLKTTKWSKIGSGFATFLNGLISKTNFSLIGQTLGAKLNAIIGLAWGFVSTFNFSEAGLGLADLINGWFNEVNWEQLGDTLGQSIQGLVDFAFSFITNFDAAEAAKSFATTFNRMLKKIDFKKLGKTVSNAFIKVWEFIGTALKEIDWKNIGKSISEFLNGIDWGGILRSLFGVIGGLLKAMPNLLKGLIENLDFEAASSFFAFMLAPKMAGGLLNMFKTDTGIIGKLTDAGKSAGTTIGGGITNTAQNTGGTFGSKFSAGLTKAYPYIEAAIVGWQIGTLIYNAAKPAIDEITDYMSGLGKNGGLSAEDIEEAGKSTTTLKRMYNTQQFIKKWGLTYKITRKDVENNSEAYKAIRDVRTIMEKYPSVVAAGYHPSRLLADPELREQILKGNLPKNVTPAQYQKTDRERINEKIAETWKQTAEKQARKEAQAKGITNESWIKARAAAIYSIWEKAKKIPFLARGTVVPANFGRFAAVLGDNKKEPEVVSPLSTMRQAVMDALAAQGKQKQPITINISLDTRRGKRLISTEVIDDINDIIDSTGKVPINIDT